jgi:hypothetical protein
MLNKSTGKFAIVVDKWNPKEAEGHTLVEYAGRGLGFPDDDTEPWVYGSYVGTYKFMPDGKTWTGAGTGTETFKGGDTRDTTTYTWEESSDNVYQNTYKYTGGTGKYEGTRGSGTYSLYDNVSVGGIKPGDLQGCKYKDEIDLP